MLLGIRSGGAENFVPITKNNNFGGDPLDNPDVLILTCAWFLCHEGAVGRKFISDVSILIEKKEENIRVIITVQIYRPIKAKERTYSI